MNDQVRGAESRGATTHKVTVKLEELRQGRLEKTIRGGKLKKSKREVKKQGRRIGSDPGPTTTLAGHPHLCVRLGSIGEGQRKKRGGEGNSTYE